MPSRFLDAFPPGTPIRRVTLDEAISSIAGLSPAAKSGHERDGLQSLLGEDLTDL